MREKQGANSPVDMMEALRPRVSSPLCCLLQGHDDSTELVLEGRGGGRPSFHTQIWRLKARPDLWRRRLATLECELRDNGPQASSYLTERIRNSELTSRDSWQTRPGWLVSGRDSLLFPWVHTGEEEVFINRRAHWSRAWGGAPEAPAGNLWLWPRCSLKSSGNCSPCAQNFDNAGHWSPEACP